mmetsp:Transcript_757/g.1980  ORF Transcript_757/g.1980 Transcript_757/m.1980 type:complete len:264 (-) Transcript_757:49-840(-)
MHRILHQWRGKSLGIPSSPQRHLPVRLELEHLHLVHHLIHLLHRPLDLLNVTPTPAIIRARKEGITQPCAVPRLALDLILRLLPRRRRIHPILHLFQKRIHVVLRPTPVALPDVVLPLEQLPLGGVCVLGQTVRKAGVKLPLVFIIPLRALNTAPKPVAKHDCPLPMRHIQHHRTLVRRPVVIHVRLPLQRVAHKRRVRVDRASQPPLRILRRPGLGIGSLSNLLRRRGRIRVHVHDDGGKCYSRKPMRGSIARRADQIRIYR